MQENWAYIIHDQLAAINERTWEVLNRATNCDKLAKELAGAAEAMTVYEGDPIKRDLYLEAAYKRIFANDQRALQAAEAIRRQLESHLKILQSLYDVQEMEAFQKEVLEAIGEVDSETKRKIVQRLNERRAVRATAHIH